MQPTGNGHPDPIANLTETWGLELVEAVCEACAVGFFLQPDSTLLRCPVCFQADLAQFNGDFNDLAYAHPPELCLPFTVSEAAVKQNIGQFVQSIRFAPPDLTVADLMARRQALYLPRWLVDSDVQAVWQAEMGFDYDRVTYQDTYQQRGGWSSQQLTETRIRWEPRLGRLERAYHNVDAPALEIEPELNPYLGEFALEAAEAYSASALADTPVHLPTRSPQDAWSDAKLNLQRAAAKECCQASGAAQVQAFRWSAEFTNLHWTQLLLPVYTTYYLNDRNQPQIVFVNGQSGQVGGTKRASWRQARRYMWLIGVVALLAFFVGALLGVVVTYAPLSEEPKPFLSFLAAGSLAAAILLVLGMIVPLVLAWEFNQSQRRD